MARLTIYLPADVENKARKAAKAQGTSLSQLSLDACAAKKN
jgi:pyruvate/2-oxoacid:ferredoxin oxidoreductase beta subunit